MTQITINGNLDCVPNYEEEYLLAEAIEEYYAGKFYAHTNADSSTVLCGRVDLVAQQRKADAEKPLWQQACDNAVNKQGRR